MFATKDVMMSYSRFTLLEGNPFEPSSTDLMVQQINLVMATQPPGDGWRILTGNVNTNLWARVAYRYEIEEGK